MKRPARLLATAALGAAVALLASACSSSADAGAGTAPNATGSAAASEPFALRVADLTTANYLTILGSGDLLGEELAPVNGTAEFVGPFIPTDAIAALAADQADATSTGTAAFVTFLAGGSDYTAFAIERYSGNSQGVVAAPNTGIENLEDLYGKRVAIGTAGGTGDYVIHRAFEEQGLDISQVELVSLTVTEAAAAFAAGQVDAWATFDQFLATAEATPGATVLVRGDEIDSLNWSIHLVNTAWAEAHPEGVAAAFRALQAQAELAAEDPSIITDAYSGFGATPEQVEVISTYSVPTIEPIDAEHLGALDELAGQLVTYGFIPEAPDVAGHVVDASTID